MVGPWPLEAEGVLSEVLAVLRGVSTKCDLLGVKIIIDQNQEIREILTGVIVAKMTHKDCWNKIKSGVPKLSNAKGNGVSTSDDGEILQNGTTMTIEKDKQFFNV